MEEVRGLMQQARQKVVGGDLQGALNDYEEAFQKSQAQQYVAGMFCCSRRLGDIYFISRNSDYALRWYDFADGLLQPDYLKSEIIQKACRDMWEKAASLCTTAPECAEKHNTYIKRIQSLTEEKVDNTVETGGAEQDYNTLVKKQDNEAKLYDAFFNNCKKNSLRLVLRYIHKGVDVNHINPQTKYTALHCACWRGHIDIVRALLRHGADMSILNSEGESCVQCAEVAKRQDVVDLLKRVQDEGIGFLGPCNECEKMKQKNADCGVCQSNSELNNGN